MYFHCVCKTTFYTEIGHFLEKPQQYNIWDQNAILCRVWYLDNTTLSCATKHVTLKGKNSIAQYTAIGNVCGFASWVDPSMCRASARYMKGICRVCDPILCCVTVWIRIGAFQARGCVNTYALKISSWFMMTRLIHGP